jgi:hypothetical protein
MFAVQRRDFDAATLDLYLNCSESYSIADAVTARDVPYFFCTGNTLNNVKDGYRDQDVLKCRSPLTI